MFGSAHKYRLRAMTQVAKHHCIKLFLSRLYWLINWQINCLIDWSTDSFDGSLQALKCASLVLIVIVTGVPDWVPFAGDSDLETKILHPTIEVESFSWMGPFSANYLIMPVRFIRDPGYSGGRSFSCLSSLYTSECKCHMSLVSHFTLHADRLSGSITCLFLYMLCFKGLIC